MRILVFDIECSDGEHICEFGYVIANEKFEIIEKDVMTINPEAPFKLESEWGHRSRSLELYFSEATYYASPNFPHYYDFIKALITAPDQIVIGHSISNDIGFLRTACDRYELDTFDFSFIDSQIVYGEFSNSKSPVSLGTAEVILNLNKPEYLHKSDEDAKLTLELIEEVCKQLEVDIHGLAELCERACGESSALACYYKGDELTEMLDLLEKNPSMLSNKKKDKCLDKFLKAVKPEGPIRHCALTGQTVAFSKQLERHRTRDTVVLIQLLVNVGCRYDKAVSHCTYYVATDKELEATEIKKRSRYYSALHTEGVKIISLPELLAILGITEEELLNTPVPDKVEEKREPPKKPKRGLVYTTAGATTGGSTLADSLLARGFDISKLFVGDDEE